jgi:glycosyltransferase involved in cell wall biosynthesis
MKEKKKVLFVGLHRIGRSPSQRYRIEQFFPYLEAAGIEYDYSYLLNENDDKIFYSPGNYLGKLIILIKSTLKRLFEVFFKAGQYDFVFVQREAYMLGTAFFEKKYAQKSKLIFDFDDSIWMQNVSAANKNLAFLKNPAKTAEIIKASNLVIAGNSYLAEYAVRFNKNVLLIPTCIDTKEYRRDTDYAEKPDGKVCIGWSGSQTTIDHFRLIEPVLIDLKKKYADKIYFKVMGDASYSHKELGIKGIAWKRETEITELEEFDIGIMPLPHDEWTKGKCGLKGLVYMSMEVPSVMEGVGVNPEIIVHGENGLLASDSEEWFNSLSMLIDNYELRKKSGKNGRETVLEKYSVISNSEKFLSVFK